MQSTQVKNGRAKVGDYVEFKINGIEQDGRILRIEKSLFTNIGRRPLIDLIVDADGRELIVDADGAYLMED